MDLITRFFTCISSALTDMLDAFKKVDLDGKGVVANKADFSRYVIKKFRRISFLKII